MLGKKLTPIIEEIEFAIIEFDSELNTKPKWGDTALRSSAKIFISVLMDKMWDMMESENIPQDTRVQMSEQCGKEVRKIIKTFCNVDSFEFYNETIVGNNFIISKSVK